MLAKVVFKPRLFFHSTFKVAVPDPKLNLKIGSAFSRVNEIKSTGPLHSDPKLKISFGNCCGKLRHFECLRGVLRRQKYVRLIFEKSFSGFRSLNC